MIKKLSDLLSAKFGSDVVTRWSGRPDDQKRQILAKQSLAFVQLLSSWDEIVGELLAKHTFPARIVAKELLILTKHSSFSQQLGFMEGVIKGKIFARFPALAQECNRLKFVTSQNFFQEREALLSDGRDHQSSQLQVNVKQDRVNPYSPATRKLIGVAQEFFSDVEDARVKDLLISIYVQQAQSAVEKVPKE